MSFELPQATPFTRMYYLGQTSLTPAIQISKAGAAFTNPNAGVANAIEVGSGWYKYALDAVDTDTLGDLAYSFGTGGESPEFHDLIVVPAGGGDPWATAIPGAYGAGTAGNVLGSALFTLINTRLPTSSYTAPNNSQIVANGNTLAGIVSGLTSGSFVIQLTTAQFNALVAAMWQTANQIDGQFTYQDCMKLLLASLAGKVAISGNTVTIRNTADTVDRLQATTDVNGQRTAVTLNVS